MRKVKQIGIKNQTYYFYNDQINLKNFNDSLIKVFNCNNINSVNPLYLRIKKMIDHFEEIMGISI